MMSQTTPDNKFKNIISEYLNVSRDLKQWEKLELEIKFGTARAFKSLSKINYDNIYQKLASLGFSPVDSAGEYSLRIIPTYGDPKKSTRFEVIGLNGAQAYCKTENMRELLSNKVVEIRAQSKEVTKELANPDKYVDHADFSDFNFRVSLNTESYVNLKKPSNYLNTMLDTWASHPKVYRYMRRITMVHPDYPVVIDMSTVRASIMSKNIAKRGEKAQYVKYTHHTVAEANVFDNPETYEVEIEVNNSVRIDKSYLADELYKKLQKTIKFVLSGIQGSNYPISLTEQKSVAREYLSIIYDNATPEQKSKFDPDRDIRSSDFVGPSSVTLQIENIVPIDPNVNNPRNINKNFTVTDKADGQRGNIFISKEKKGRVYFINNSSYITFTGATVKVNEAIMGSILDGELIQFDKVGNFFNRYAAFDIYYINRKSVRMYPFMRFTSTFPDSANGGKYRHELLTKMIQQITISCESFSGSTPMSFMTKTFYPRSVSEFEDPDYSIFAASKNLMEMIKSGEMEYNTDGLIFTPVDYGVASQRQIKDMKHLIDDGGINKPKWNLSFKWKPPHFNTVDFLVITKKDATSAADMITAIYEQGTDVASGVNIKQYKTLQLCCGFQESKHGYINPCEMILSGKYSNIGSEDSQYHAKQFIPTRPYDINGGLTNIMLTKDAVGVDRMITEEGDMFNDKTIVEFRYDTSESVAGLFKWVPIRVRYDKTAEYRAGQSNFGNDYDVANDNWHSIHNPVTEDMITTGLNIPDIMIDSDIYYNNATKFKSKTQSMRNFHNLYVKRILIKSVSEQNGTLIDYACGKAGDLAKWREAKLGFVYGIDISRDNLENRKDGACRRYLDDIKQNNVSCKVLFSNGDSSKNIRDGSAFFTEKDKSIKDAIFGQVPKDPTIGAGVTEHYDRVKFGFDVSSCQFAVHYMFENLTTFHSFARNVSECTKVGGYFVGTAYDGQSVWDLLRDKQPGESIQMSIDDEKIWEIVKDYPNGADFPSDSTSLGYKINVYQDTINQLLPEYLVNFTYFENTMKAYGFIILGNKKDELRGLPHGTGLFEELYLKMLNETRQNAQKKKDFAGALNMTKLEKMISFLNRYFVFVKINDVIAETVFNEFMANPNKVSVAPIAKMQPIVEVVKLDDKIVLEFDTTIEKVLAEEKELAESAVNPFVMYSKSAATVEPAPKSATVPKIAPPPVTKPVKRAPSTATVVTKPVKGTTSNVAKSEKEIPTVVEEPLSIAKSATVPKIAPPPPPAKSRSRKNTESVAKPSTTQRSRSKSPAKSVPPPPPPPSKRTSSPKKSPSKSVLQPPPPPSTKRAASPSKRASSPKKSPSKSMPVPPPPPPPSIKRAASPPATTRVRNSNSDVTESDDESEYESED